MRTVTIDEIEESESRISAFSQYDSTNYSYREFITFFQQRNNLTSHDITIGAYFVYGWMPKMLKIFNVSQLEHITSILNQAKIDQFPTEEELAFLRDNINNSLVGPSKLLHFINPKCFAIWDSRVFKYIEQRNAYYGDLRSIRNFLDYHYNLRQLIDQPRFSSINRSLDQKVGYILSPMRACEYVMYLSNRQ